MTRLSSVILSILLFGALAAPAGASASTVGLAKVGKLGSILVDGKGVTVYLFEKDKGGKSACYGTCAKVWAPLLTTSKPKAKNGARASLLGTTKRKDGTLQVTYHKHPLYYYDDDERKPGTAKGQDSKEFGAEWYVLDKSGNIVHGDA